MIAVLFILLTEWLGGPPADPRPQAERPAIVRATGVGYPPARVRGGRARLLARRAAEVDAVRNLCKTLGNLPGKRIRGFRYVSTTYRPDGVVEVVVEYTFGETRMAETGGRTRNPADDDG